MSRDNESNSGESLNQRDEIRFLFVGPFNRLPNPITEQDLEPGSGRIFPTKPIEKPIITEDESIESLGIDNKEAGIDNSVYRSVARGRNRVKIPRRLLVSLAASALVLATSLNFREQIGNSAQSIVAGVIKGIDNPPEVQISREYQVRYEAQLSVGEYLRLQRDLAAAESRRIIQAQAVLTQQDAVNYSQGLLNGVDQFHKSLDNSSLVPASPSPTVK